MQLARECQRRAEPLILDDCAGRHRLDLVEHPEWQGDTVVPDSKAPVRIIHHLDRPAGEPAREGRRVQQKHHLVIAQREIAGELALLAPRQDLVKIVGLAQGAVQIFRVRRCPAETLIVVIVAADADNNGVGSVLDGGAGANQLYALVGSGNDYAVGGEGTDIIATGAGSDYIFGNAGDDTIVAGTGTDYIYGNAGKDFIYTDDLVTPSQDFVYVSGLSGFGTGIDTVADFTPGPGGDVAVIVGTPGLTSFAQVQAAMTDVDVYTVIDLSGGNQLYLYNVDPSQLTADNFLFL